MATKMMSPRKPEPRKPAPRKPEPPRKPAPRKPEPPRPFNGTIDTDRVDYLSPAGRRPEPPRKLTGTGTSNSYGTGNIDYRVEGGGVVYDRFPNTPETVSDKNAGKGTYQKGGKVRGYGKARGGRPCKMG